MASVANFPPCLYPHPHPRTRVFVPLSGAWALLSASKAVAMSDAADQPDRETQNAAFHVYREHLAHVVTQALAQGTTYEERKAIVDAKMQAWSQRITDHVYDLQWHLHQTQELEHVAAVDRSRGDARCPPAPQPPDASAGLSWGAPLWLWRAPVVPRRLVLGCPPR